MHVMFAFSTKGSLMMLTVNPFVDLMFCAVSLGSPVGWLDDMEMEMSGGLCVAHKERI